MATSAIGATAYTLRNPDAALMRSGHALPRREDQPRPGGAFDHFGRSALERVSTLLLQIARNNAYEGRDPELIPDALSCGFVADLLDLDVGALADVVIALEHRGLVQHMDGGGLRLVDRAGLEALANLH